MSDNDLIRRGDALNLVEDYVTIYDRMSIIPAVSAKHDFVQPTVSPEQLAAQSDDVAALVEAGEALAEQAAHVRNGALIPQMNIHRSAKHLGPLVDAWDAALARVKSKEGFSDEKGVV